MEKRYTVRQAVTLTGVKSYVLRYWEEELELRIGRNELGHRYYTPFDIQLFLKINELKSKGLSVRKCRERKKESTGVVLWMKRSAGSSRQEEKRQLPVREKRIKKTEKAAGKPAASFIIAAYQANDALLSRDSTNWTGLSACSAVNTSVCVDYIMLVSLRNSLVRALTLTCSTANALVRNYICHN